MDEKRARKAISALAREVSHKLVEEDYGAKLPRNVWKSYEGQVEYYDAIETALLRVLGLEPLAKSGDNADSNEPRQTANPRG